MKIGLSTYSLYWHFSKENPNALTVEQLLEEVKKYGVNLFQICDVEELEVATDEELERMAKKAKQLGIELEVGTKGIAPGKLQRYLQICEKLESKILRTMINSIDFAPTHDEAVHILKEFSPIYEDRGISIAIETYEQQKTENIVQIVKAVDRPNVGICLDPANCIANLEYPKEVINVSAPFVKNLHLKDFVFERKEGWIGFSLIGTAVGDGKLDIHYMVDILKQHDIDVNAIIEFWLPYIHSIEETIAIEKQWIAKSIAYVQENLR